jgi:hypothetical protein
MASIIYLGPNNPKLGLATYQIYLGEFPPNVASALKANPGLQRHFIDFETFANQRPPGAPPLRTAAASPAIRGTPIKKKSGSFITIGKK